MNSQVLVDDLMSSKRTVASLVQSDKELITKLENQFQNLKEVLTKIDVQGAESEKPQDK